MQTVKYRIKVPVLTLTFNRLKKGLSCISEHPFTIHALWYIRVWSIRVSTRFLKKIRVYKCPFSGNFKGIFLCEYSDYEMVKGGYKGTHQYSFKGSHKGKLPLICLGGKTFKKHCLIFQMLSYNRVNCRKKVFIDAMQAQIPDPSYMV